MSKFKTFPRTAMRVIDDSAQDVYTPEALPLHLPLFVGFGEKGVGMGYGVYSELKKQFGAGTFDSRSDWFRHPNFFLRTACENQPAFFYRLMPEDVKQASLVLEADVWDEKITQYERDVDGRFIRDTNNALIPIAGNAIRIKDLAWDEKVHTDSDTVVLTVSADNSVDSPITLTVTCSDISVVITPDVTFPNLFSIVYPDYSGARTEVTYTVTAVDDDTNTTITTMTYVVNPTAADASYGYYWSDDTHESKRFYTLNTINADGTTDVDVVASDAINVSVMQDNNDVARFFITYGAFETYPTPIEFTIVAAGGETLAPTETTFTDTKSVTELGAEFDFNTEFDGTRVKWRTRPLEPSETITGLLKATRVVGETTITTYPILAFSPKSGPGAYANNIGVKLYWDREANEVDVVNENQAVLFSIAFVDQPYGLDSPEVIRDFFGSVGNDFMFYKDGINSAVDQRIDFSSIMLNNYREKLPLNYNMFSQYVTELSERILVNESSYLDELTSPWMVNFVEAETIDGVPYYTVLMDTDSSDAALLDKDIVHYLQGGSDGTITDENLESLSEAFFQGNVFPEMRDAARWPFNHVYDSGYKLETKYAMFDLMYLREDVHVIVSTQDVYGDYNTQSEDQAAASALRIRALLYPESVIDGTACCRVTIFQQACKVNFDDTYREIVPMTMKALLSRCVYNNAAEIKGEWMGLPAASVDFIREISWAPFDPEIKQLNWDTAANYCQYYDMVRLHYPSIISVNPKLTSLLSSDTFVTYIVYLKQLVNRTWAKYVGLEEPIPVLKSKIETDLNSTIYRKFQNYIKVSPKVYQSDQDKALGYAITVELVVNDTVANRLWNVPIYCRRTEETA